MTLILFVLFLPLFTSAGINTCIDKVLKNYGLPSLLYVYDDYLDLETILSRVHVSVYSGRVDLAKGLGKFDFYVFVIYNLQNFKVFLQNLQFTSDYRSETRTLVYTRRALVEEVLEILWYINLVNVIVLSEDLSFYTYYPISAGYCGLAPAHFLFHFSNYTISNGVYNESKAMSFGGCVARIYAVAIEPYVSEGGYDENWGLEMIILRQLLAKLNVTAFYLENEYPFWGQKLPNGTFTMMWGQLQKNQAEFVLGFVAESSTFDNINFPFISHFNFFSPIALQKQPWKNIFLVFDWHVWSLILLILPLMTLTWTLLSHKPIIDSLIFTLQLLLSSRPYTQRATSNSIAYISWIFPSFLLVSFFQSVLISVMFRPVFDKQITTIEEMVDSTLSYGGFYHAQTYFYNSGNEVIQKIYDNYKNCSMDGSDCYERAITKRDICPFQDRRFTVLLMQRRKGSLYKMNYELISHVALHVQKGYPLKSRLEDVMGRLFQAGLVDKWDLYNNPPNDDGESRKSKKNKLTLVHLQSTFAILVIGILAAIIAFVLEILSANRGRVLRVDIN